MSKFGIGPTLDKLQTNTNSNSSGASTAPNSHPHVLMNSSTNVPIVSSPKHQLKSPNNKSQAQNLIESNVPNYTKRNSQPVVGHNLLRSESKSDSDSFLLPPMRKLPEALANRDGPLDLKAIVNANSSDVLNALIRCVCVPYEQLNQVDFVDAENGLILVSCDLIK